MRLFHVSEEGNIDIFYPRLPTRKDLDPHVGLVWAVDEKRLPNFLTPRDCPRVTYHAGEGTSPQDAARYFSSSTLRHAVVIEQQWFERMGQTRLYLYEFEPTDFVLQDAVAGYYVATKPQAPKAKHEIRDVFAALWERQVELRVVDCLWDLAEEIRHTTLNWSLCRMGNACQKGETGTIEG